MIILWMLIFSCLPVVADVLPAKPPVPSDNPLSPEKIELGKQLFFDPRISKPGHTACLTCHNVMAGGDDSHAFSVKPDGALSARSAPTVWNAAFLSSFFWYGEAASLEEQAEGPLGEMGLGDTDAVVKNVTAISGYREEFKSVFGSGSKIDLKKITQAIASYERTLITPDSAYDRFMKGDEHALSTQALRGLKSFNSMGCVSCHSGTNFAGPSAPQGQAWLQKFPVYEDDGIEAQFHFMQDLGRYNVTQREEDKHFFRVPQLRNIELTAPYFHNGAVSQLNDAVRIMAKTQLNQTLSTGEIDDIAAFLKSLTGKIPEQKMPILPPLSGTTLTPN